MIVRAGGAAAAGIDVNPVTGRGVSNNKSEVAPKE
jgi:hypothetical protein